MKGCTKTERGDIACIKGAKAMFFKVRSVRENQQYDLIKAITQARKQMRALHHHHLCQCDYVTADIPLILAELRFRYLLHQARIRNWNNGWDLD